MVSKDVHKTKGRKHKGALSYRENSGKPPGKTFRFMLIKLNKCQLSGIIYFNLSPSPGWIKSIKRERERE